MHRLLDSLPFLGWLAFAVLLALVLGNMLLRRWLHDVPRVDDGEVRVLENRLNYQARLLARYRVGLAGLRALFGELRHAIKTGDFCGGELLGRLLEEWEKIEGEAQTRRSA